MSTTLPKYLWSVSHTIFATCTSYYLFHNFRRYTIIDWKFEEKFYTRYDLQNYVMKQPSSLFKIKDCVHSRQIKGIKKAEMMFPFQLAIDGSQQFSIFSFWKITVLNFRWTTWYMANMKTVVCFLSICNPQISYGRPYFYMCTTDLSSRHSSLRPPIIDTKTESFWTTQLSKASLPFYVEVLLRYLHRSPHAHTPWYLFFGSIANVGPHSRLYANRPESETRTSRICGRNREKLRSEVYELGR